MPALIRSKEAHVVHSAAALAVDEVTRPELLDFGQKVTRAENIRQGARGAAVKRNGFTALSNTRTDGTTPALAMKMLMDGNALARVVDNQLESYSQIGARWKQLGRVSEASQRLIDIPTIAFDPVLGAATGDVCYCNGYFAFAWTSTNTGAPLYNTITAVMNASTGAVVRQPELVGVASGTNSRPLLACYGVYVIVIWASGATTFSAMYIDTTSSATIATGWIALGGTNVITDKYNGGACYAIHSLTDRIAFLYSNNGAVPTSLVTCSTLDITGVLQTKVLNSNSILASRVALCGSSADTLWCAWAETTVIQAQGLTPGTLSVTLATKAAIMTMLTGTGNLGIAQGSVAGTARVIANDTSVATQLRMRSIVTTAGAAVPSGTEVRVASANVTGRPWQVGGRYYVTVTADTVQKTVVVVDWTDAVTYLRPVALFAPGLATPLAGTSGFCDAQATVVAGPTTTKFYVFSRVTRSGVADTAQLAEIDFASTTRWQSVAHGNSTYLTGGILSSFDGVRAAEMGFLFRPTKPTTATSGTGISATTGWRYVCVYEEVDADGNWHISGLSNPSTSTGAVANKTVTVTTQPLTVTSRLNTLPTATNGVRVAFYRTLDGGVAPYYRVGTSVNDTTALTTTYADIIPDATLAANAVLYSQPGVLGTAQDRRPPPGLSRLVAYNNMLVGSSGSDVWFSGQNVPGEGTWFNPIFQVPVPGAGDIIALAVMDGTLFAFKQREVYAIAGDAPSDNGTSGGLGLPRRLATDLGCIDARTVCATSLGIFFQSDRGIEILTRAQTVEWIGEPYSVSTSAFPICTSITVDPRSNCVIAELATSESSGLVSGTGCALIFDLSLKTWISKDRRTSLAAPDAPSQSACMVYTGTAWRYGWLSSTGFIFTENDTHLDADAFWVTSLVETASFKHGLQQAQRVWAGKILYEHTGASGLKIEVGYDYGVYSSANDKVWPEAETISGGRQLEWRPRSGNMAVRFRISDSAPAVLGTGAGITFVGISLDTAPKQGTSTGTPRLDPSLRK